MGHSLIPVTHWKNADFNLIMYIFHHILLQLYKLNCCIYWNLVKWHLIGTFLNDSLKLWSYIFQLHFIQNYCFVFIEGKECFCLQTVQSSQIRSIWWLWKGDSRAVYLYGTFRLPAEDSCTLSMIKKIKNIK